MDSGAYEIEHVAVANSGRYDTLDEEVVDVVRGVRAEMRRQPAHMVYEMIDARLRGPLPGVVVDHETLRDAAAKTSVVIPI